MNFIFQFTKYYQTNILGKLFFRLITASKSSATSKIFTSFPPESDFGRVYANNIDEKSYTTSQKNAIETVLSNSQTALYYTSSGIWDSDAYLDCQVYTFCF